MLGKREVDAELRRSLGSSMKEMQPIFATGGDPAERKFSTGGRRPVAGYTRRGNCVDCPAAHSLRMADLCCRRHCARCKRIGVRRPSMVSPTATLIKDFACLVPPALAIVLRKRRQRLICALDCRADLGSFIKLSSWSVTCRCDDS